MKTAIPSQEQATEPAASAHTPLTAREVGELSDSFEEGPTERILAWAWERFGTRASIGTSFQGAGLVIMHIAQSQGLKFPVFTLDTGLLFDETLALKTKLEDFFGYPIESLHPDLTVEQQEEAQGPELWKRNPDLCCTIRKVLPLQSKLRQLDAWITGLRRQQSDERSKTGILELYEFDKESGREIVKINPLANWKRQEVWDYIHRHGIPYNPLHDQGYRSIGCRTCTVAGPNGQGERAGRWTGFNKVECGIHTFMTKKIDFQI